MQALYPVRKVALLVGVTEYDECSGLKNLPGRADAVKGLSAALEDAGFAISRRTVQKHREHLNIPSSRDRRQR